MSFVKKIFSVFFVLLMAGFVYAFLSPGLAIILLPLAAVAYVVMTNGVANHARYLPPAERDEQVQHELVHSVNGMFMVNEAEFYAVEKRVE